MGTIKRPMAAVFCFVAAGTAFAGIVHVEGQAVLARPHAAAVRDRAPASSPGTLAVPAHRVVAAPPAAPAPLAADVPAAPAAPAAAPEPIAVPNLYGLRLTYAERRIERRGLVVEARDLDGNPVDLSDREFYRVVGQSVARGTEVAPGTTITVTVRDRAASYSDWG